MGRRHTSINCLIWAAAGFLLGFPVLRLRGDYLAIVTLGFGEIVRILLLNNTEITGGPNGISQIPKPTLFGLEFSRTAREGGWDTFSNFFGLKYDPSDRVIFLYLVALLLVVLSLFVINRLLRMPLGRAWEALREDEIACRSLGLSPRRIKLTAFTISAAFAGFAGTLFAGLPGKLLLAFMGLLFVLAIISGTVLYLPFMRRHEFATVRTDNPMKRQSWKRSPLKTRNSRGMW